MQNQSTLCPTDWNTKVLRTWSNLTVCNCSKEVTTHNEDGHGGLTFTLSPIVYFLTFLILIFRKNYSKMAQYFQSRPIEVIHDTKTIRTSLDSQIGQHRTTTILGTSHQEDVAFGDEAAVSYYQEVQSTWRSRWKGVHNIFHFLDLK